MLKRKKIGFIIAILLFSAILFMEDFDPSKSHLNIMAAIAVLMAVLWITEALPLSVTSLIPLVLYPLTGILTADEIAASYINSIIFLFLGGFLIAISMEEWGLHKRIALKLITHFGGSPNSIIIGFITAGAFLSMWISNTATALMLLPIALAIITKLEDRFSIKQLHNYSIILLLSIAYSCTLGGLATLVGTPPNLVFVQTLNILFPEAPQILFSSWMMLAVPVSVIMLLVVGFLLTRVFFKTDRNLKLDSNFVKEEYKKLGKPSYEEKTVSIIFCITALLWVFRSNINFGIFEIPGWSNLLKSSDFVNDGTVAIGMAFVLFLIPSKNKNRTILDSKAFIKVPWGIILLFGGGFALAKGFASTGLSHYIGEQLSGLSSFSPIIIIIITAALISFLTELTSNTATTQMILPILASVSIAMQLNPLLLMLTATLSASMAFMLPVATPPNTIIFASNRLKISEMAKTGFALNILGIIIVSLLVYFLSGYIFDSNIFPAWAETN